MPRGKVFGLILAFVGLAMAAVYVAWAFHAAATKSLGWAALRSAWPYLLAGVLTVECLIAGFVWLAFFSERRGYDDRPDLHD